MISRKRFGLWLAAAVFVCGFCTAAYGGEQDTFVTGTFINGIDVGGQTVEGAKGILEKPDGYQLEILKKNGEKDIIRGSEIGYRATVTGDLGAVLAKQNEEGRVTGPAIKHEFTVDMTAAFDQAALTERIANLPCVKGEGVIRTADARISDYEEGKEFTIIKEVYGEDVEPDKVKAVITSAVAKGQNSVNLSEQGCYRNVAVTSEDPRLKEMKDMMNRCRTMKITYVFGENEEILDGSVIASWLTGFQDGQVQVDAQKALSYIQALAGKYDTAGRARVFKTVAGREVELTGPFGWQINQSHESAALIAMIQTAQSQSREPQYVQIGAQRGLDWGVTYAEVDLTNQHVYMIKDGSVVWDAPCVTGDMAKGYATPEGIYSLTYKEKDRILRGRKQADGSYEYESHVDYWMPFNGGIGFHDASWRSNFGGTIYMSSGSHGCINLPPDRAALLYEYVYKGMPVICYH